MKNAHEPINWSQTPQNCGKPPCQKSLLTRSEMNMNTKIERLQNCKNTKSAKVHILKVVWPALAGCWVWGLAPLVGRSLAQVVPRWAAWIAWWLWWRCSLVVMIKMVKLNHLFLKSILLFVNSIASPVGRATLGRQDPSPENIISTIDIISIIVSMIISIRINLTVDVLIAFIP